MSPPLSRSGLAALALGASAGLALGLIAFIVHRSRRRALLRTREAGAGAGAGAGTGTATPDTPPGLQEDGGQLAARRDAEEAELQRQVVATVHAVVQGLSPEQQLEVRDQLEQVLSCVASLRSEVAELRGGLQNIAAKIIHDVKKGVEDGHRVRRRRHVSHQDDRDSTCSSSIYFTASQGVASTSGETSEGGYSTAYAESDYSDREEADRADSNQSDQEDDVSSATTFTLRQEDSPEEEEQQEDEEEEEQQQQQGGGRLQLLSQAPSGELALLMAQSDVLHTGDASLKAQGFQLLLDNRDKYGDNKDFLWRLARAYSDMYKSTGNQQEKRDLAQQGLEEAEMALKKNGLNTACHKWFAVLTGLASQQHSMHRKIKSFHVQKEHLDLAMAHAAEDPMCLQLLGRWCYQVANLDWMERKAAAALYQPPPTSSLQQALSCFLKAEDVSPGSSKAVRLYIAKCYKELGNVSEATCWTKLALNMPSDTSKDEESSELEDQLQALIEKDPTN